jgi:hypothetical protein
MNDKNYVEILSLDGVLCLFGCKIRPRVHRFVYNSVLTIKWNHYGDPIHPYGGFRFGPRPVPV